MNFLYRGVSVDLDKKNNGRLIPKATGTFEAPALWDDAVWDSGETYDTSTANAVVRHQRNQEGFPTSGISTTPHFKRAEFYATRGGATAEGFIYKIDRSKLVAYGVSEFIVSKFATNPSIPEDEEVILVNNDFGPLPQELVTEVHAISAQP